MTPLTLGFYALILLGIVDFLAWLILLYRFEVGFRRAPKLPRQYIDQPTRRVAAVVAARNEEETIAECIRSLLSQTCINSVIVVDDASTDKTYEEAKKFASDDRVHVLRLGGNGAGKAEACYFGVGHTDADWLLFVDADTRLKPGFVSRALVFAEEKGLDALSVVGQLRCPSFWDKVSTPFLFGLLNSFIRLDYVCDRGRKSAYFYGSFILIKRDAYMKIGGHRAVKDDIVEDRALGSLAKKSGLNICIAQAPDSVSAEWAPGFRSNLKAMQRVIAPSINRRVGLGSAFSFALTALFFIPLLLITLSLSGLTQTLTPINTIGAFLGVSSLVLVAALSVRSAQRIGSNPLYSLLFILPEAVFSYALWSSIHKVLRGKPIVWRNRAYVYTRRAN